MPDTLAKIKEASVVADEIAYTPFGKYEEQAIISLALDQPEFFGSVGRFLAPNMFGIIECKYIIAEILNVFEEHGVVPTRDLLRDKLISTLTEDDPYDEILEIVDRKSNYRDVPLIKDTLLKWARDKAYGQIYSSEAQEAYARGDYGYLEQIIQEANRIADIGNAGFWFFESFKSLLNPEIIEHRTTGFPSLDKHLNNGGPSPKEVVCYLAPTNVGKSILLCNSAIASLKGATGSGYGQDVLLITFELDYIKTALRCLGVMCQDIPIDKVTDHKDYVIRIVEQLDKQYKRRFLIVEWPPDECSVNHIYALLDSLKRTHGWHPDVIVLDYLDLIVSRNQAYNSDDYTQQKHVANEVRGLAKNENVLIFTATQTNRSATQTGREGGESLIDLNKAAESFAKQFSLDYVVSLNQTAAQRNAAPPRMTMYIAKNRNGPKFISVDCAVTYETMVVKEV